VPLKWQMYSFLISNLRLGFCLTKYVNYVIIGSLEITLLQHRSKPNSRPIRLSALIIDWDLSYKNTILVPLKGQMCSFFNIKLKIGLLSN
jgi:hypothetical protein